MNDLISYPMPLSHPCNLPSQISGKSLWDGRSCHLNANHPLAVVVAGHRALAVVRHRPGPIVVVVVVVDLHVEAPLEINQKGREAWTLSLILSLTNSYMN